MDKSLLIYSAGHLRSITYRYDIEAIHTYIVNSAKSGYLYADFEVSSERDGFVLRELRTLFPGCIFTNMGQTGATTSSFRSVKYRVGWQKPMPYYPYKTYDSKY